MLHNCVDEGKKERKVGLYVIVRIYPLTMVGEVLWCESVVASKLVSL